MPAAACCAAKAAELLSKQRLGAATTRKSTGPEEIWGVIEEKERGGTASLCSLSGYIIFN